MKTSSLPNNETDGRTGGKRRSGAIKRRGTKDVAGRYGQWTAISLYGFDKDEKQ